MQIIDKIAVDTTDGLHVFTTDQIRDQVMALDLAEVLEWATEDGAPTFEVLGLAVETLDGGVLQVSAVVQGRYADEEDTGAPDLIPVAALSPSFWKSCAGDDRLSKVALPM